MALVKINHIFCDWACGEQIAEDVFFLVDHDGKEEDVCVECFQEGFAHKFGDVGIEVKVTVADTEEQPKIREKQAA